MPWPFKRKKKSDETMREAIGADSAEMRAREATEAEELGRHNLSVLPGPSGPVSEAPIRATWRDETNSAQDTVLPGSQGSFDEDLRKRGEMDSTRNGALGISPPASGISPIRSGVTISLVDRDVDILGYLVDRIASSSATQVLVAGAAAFRHFHSKVESRLGRDWRIIAPPYGPTNEDIRFLAESFAQANHDEPSTRVVCYGPFDDTVVRRLLFNTTDRGYYTGAVYVVGIPKYPITFLDGLRDAIDGSGKASCTLECVFALDDVLLTGEGQRKLRGTIGQPQLLHRTAIEYFRLVERFH